MEWNDIDFKVGQAKRQRRFVIYRQISTCIQWGGWLKGKFSHGTYASSSELHWELQEPYGNPQNLTQMLSYNQLNNQLLHLGSIEFSFA